jgi:hypothetical protein
MAKILIACEESQRVTIEFRKLGHEAYSCDIEQCSGGYPEWHFQQDVTPLLQQNWDLIIAFPPCTFLSNAGAVHLYPKGILNEQRYQKGLLAKEFFMQFYDSQCKRIAIENQTPSKIFDLPKPSQIIQPYYFGHDTTKRTLLWLKGLPELKPTKIVEPITNTKIAGNWYNAGGKERQKNRSKTFEGIAKAMAEQWSKFL